MAAAFVGVSCGAPVVPVMTAGLGIGVLLALIAPRVSTGAEPGR